MCAGFHDEGDRVLDPFIGSGTTAIAALQHNRRAIGIDRDARYVELARHRLDCLCKVSCGHRPLGKPAADLYQARRWLHFLKSG